MYKWEILRHVRFVIDTSIIFNEIDYISNTNSGQLYKKYRSE